MRTCKLVAADDVKARIVLQAW